MQTQEQKRLYNRELYKRKRGHRIETAKLWVEANPDKVTYYRRTRQLKRDHGMTRAQYDTFYQQQQGVCYICHSKETHRSFKHLSVDHNHTTGEWRKLLCHQCNVMVGMSRENIHILQAAIVYLQEHEVPSGVPATDVGSQSTSTVG